MIKVEETQLNRVVNQETQLRIFFQPSAVLRILRRILGLKPICKILYIKMTVHTMMHDDLNGFFRVFSYLSGEILRKKKFKQILAFSNIEVPQRLLKQC